MKLASLAILSSSFISCAYAHATVWGVWVNGVDQGDGRNQYIRSPPNNNPVKDLTLPAMTCNVNNNPVPRRVTVNAGDQFTFEWCHNTRGDDIIAASHHGPVQVWIAPASGDNWTKLFSDGYSNGSWGVDKLIAARGKHTITIPQVPAGDYLLRAEIVALHEADVAYTDNPLRGAQNYMSCTQITVASGGNQQLPGGTSWPGAYTESTPGIVFNIYERDPTEYVAPGGPVWSGAAGGSIHSKLDLLVRVRYSNPLPAPPCPPKLLDIPTNPKRYTRPEFLNELVNETPLPMIVDAELGMPLDLGKFECLWEEGADDSALNPDPLNLPKLDPRDAFLLSDPSSSTGMSANAGNSSGASTPLAHVSWLRKTEYISREGVSKSSSQDLKAIQSAPIDISRNAQLRDIEASFAAANDNFDLSTLKHPNKPDVTAVESYPILPDAEIWPNQYDLFRFSERPGDRPVDVEDERLDCAILRPMKTEHDSFLAYYLTQDDESALKLKETRAALAPYEVPEDQEADPVPNEFLLVLWEGDAPLKFEDVIADGAGKSTRREKGAYYKNIERKMLLKKKRANQYEQYDDKWEVIRLTHAPISEEEETERQEYLAEVSDPDYLLKMRTDADAEGEIEVDDMMFMNDATAASVAT
ncbi:hypothetical protein NP233_g12556 [Leucocoprinus birnbaumii]|uniref:AA9 family lytic polysaccharide monooxygenase n=1 Tax=Leucocoprinus birnbaumii TaxID=56174 RepID=A0AAD5VET5_9AGAR|nr:hypothetical protein NP233_g12556 [Leucocoprinus birnbaumii]